MIHQISVFVVMCSGCGMKMGQTSPDGPGAVYRTYDDAVAATIAAGWALAPDGIWCPEGGHQ